MFVNVYDAEHQYECLKYDVCVENIWLWIVFSVFVLNNYPSSGHGRETAWVRRLWLMVRINDSFLDTPALAASQRRKDPWHMAVRHKVRWKMSQNFCFCWISWTAGMQWWDISIITRPSSNLSITYLQYCDRISVYCCNIPVSVLISRAVAGLERSD